MEYSLVAIIVLIIGIIIGGRLQRHSFFPFASYSPLLIFSPPLQGNVAQCIQDPNFDSEDPSSPGEVVQFKSITNIKRTDIELL